MWVNIMIKIDHIKITINAFSMKEKIKYDMQSKLKT